MVRQKRLRKRSARTGATCVEFAVVAPVIFLLFMGAIEMTRLNFLVHTAGNAAYEGARQAIVPGGNEDDAVTESMRLLTIVHANQGSEVDFEESPDQVTVTVRIPVNLNSWGISRFATDSIITQSCTLRREKLQGSSS
jgi:Flp pilus assembly protein TadG